MGKPTVQQVLASDKKKKQRLVNALGGKCCLCGYNKCLSALQFHHTDPNQKDFAISDNAHMAFEKALEEAKKCILVCANCHREIHAGLIETLPATSYNEELANIEREELQKLKTKKIFYCVDCGKQISYGATRCAECVKKYKRSGQERPNREQLKNMIRVLPFTQIGKQYNVTDNAVRKWCDAYDLPRTKKVINIYSDDEWKEV